jgi:uncharacterized protein (DUF305 family)
MTPIRTRSLAGALAAACALAAPATAQHQHGGHSHAVAAMPSDSARWTEADAYFMTHMIAHHGQAVEMARLAPERAQSNSVRTLAARIISAQEDEIATMRQWLADRRQPVPEIMPTAMHQAAGHEMPGMLSLEQMQRLEQSRGAEFDQLFLSSMIQHHRGATQMVTTLFGSQGAGQDETVFRFATDVNVDQETEIARMQRMLADLLFASPSP